MRREDIIVEVRDRSLNRVGTITTKFLNLKATIRHNGVGEWELTLPKAHPMVEHLLTTGSGIIVTLRGETRFSGQTTRPRRDTNQTNPDGTYTFKGVTDDILLLDSLAFPDPSVADPGAQTVSNDTRTGVAETLMRQYVSANICAGVAPVGRVAGFRNYLRVETVDQFRGVTVTKSPRFQNLMELLFEIATFSDLGFQVIQRGNDLVFEVLTLSDRSDTVRLDIRNGTLTSESSEVTSPSVTRAIVAGQGEGAGRLIIQRVTTESSTSEADWGRVIEQFVDQRNSESVTELEQSGDEKLIAGQLATTSIKAIPADDQTMLYGSDWELGDKIAVVLDGIEAKTNVTAATLIVNNEMSAIGAAIGDVTEFDADAALVKRVENVETRTANLERNEAAGGGITEPVNSLQWNTAFTGGSTAPGMIAWNDLDGTLEFQMKGGLVTQQIGMEQYVRVKNNTGATINEGTAVYISSSDGTNFNISKALATGDTTSAQTLGVLTENIANGGHGYVTTFGLVRNINTSHLVEGATVYLSGVTAGATTATKPFAPTHLVYVGYCLRAHATTGVLFVNVQNGYELDELHDVSIGTKADNDLLAYDSASGLWKNQTASAAGITPAGIGAAATSHTHAATDVTSGTFATARIPNITVAMGGTGATNAADARTNLGVTIANIGAAATSHTHAASDIVSGQLGTAFGGMPTGAIIQFGGATAPTGYLLCDGTAVSRTTYSALFTVLNTTYGAGDGTTTFNTPDLRGRVPMGAGTGAGEDSSGTGLPSGTALTARARGAWGGSQDVALSIAELPVHSHANTASTDSQGGHFHTATTGDAGSHSHTVTVSGGAHTHILPMGASGAPNGVNDTPLRSSGGADGNFRTGFEATAQNYASGTGTHSHSTSVSTQPNHNHSVTTNTTGAHTHTVTMTNANAGSGNAHTNLQPFMVVNYIIKT